MSSWVEVCSMVLKVILKFLKCIFAISLLSPLDIGHDYMTYMAIPWHKNPCIHGYNFCRHFICHHYFIFGLSDLSPGVQKKSSIKKQCIFTIYMTYMATPLHTRTPALDLNLRHKKWWDRMTDNVTQ